MHHQVGLKHGWVRGVGLCENHAQNPMIDDRHPYWNCHFGVLHEIMYIDRYVFSAFQQTQIITLNFKIDIQSQFDLGQIPIVS